jgi:hypothetical protein
MLGPMTRWWVGVGCAAGLLACGEGDPGAGLAVPDPGTSHVMYGTASAGRALRPSAVTVAARAGLEQLSPELIGGSGVDMVFAGVDPADLPGHLDILDLRFVAAEETGARPLVPLYDPYILRRPSDPEAPEPLVPVAGSGLSRDEREERASRLSTLLEGLAVADPCVALPTPLTVSTPRTSAELIRTMRLLSNRDVAMGFAMTSTVMLGLLPAGGGEVRAVPLPTAEPLLQTGESGEVRWLSEDEVEVDGRRLPRALTLDVKGGFGSSGVAVVWSEAARRYVPDTPFTREAAPRSLRGLVKLPLDGVASECAFGGDQGSDRSAAVWCRTETSTVWRLSLSLPRAVLVTAVIPRPQERHLAVDATGTVFQYAGRDGWGPLLESSVNAGCDPLCAAFTTTLPAAGEGSLITVAAGAQAQLLLVEDRGGVTARRPEPLDEALFADERPDGQDPLRISAVALAPDGSLFIADARPTLLRLSAAGDRVDRICLPKETRDVPIASLLAHPDGRLLVGMSPALLGVGAWQ